MTTPLRSQAQRDQAWTGEDEEWVRETVMGFLKELHTSMPGIIKSYDPKTQTATVQPAIKRVFIQDGPQPLPLCLDVPVIFLQGGPFVMTWPIAAGDECLLHFSERAIDNWWDRGGVQEPSEVRFHDLSDGFAIVGVNSRSRFIQNVATDAVELRTRDGQTMFRLEGGFATAGTQVGAELAIKGQTYRTGEGGMNNALIAALTAFNAVSAVIDPTEYAAFVVLYPTIGATITALKVFLPLWLAAVEGFEAGAAGYLATKAKVG